VTRTEGFNHVVLSDELMRDAESTRVSDVALSQPITVALQLCLVDLLRSWGITPSAITSHSSGEIAAAYSAGRLSFDEALGVAYWRGELALRKRLMSLSGGMMAVRISSEDVVKYITDLPGGFVVVACVNSPTSVTLSGDMVALEEVSGRLKADGFSPTKLNVPLAYHSHHMLSMGQEYTDHLKRILSTPPGGQWSSEIRFVSPVTGDIVQAPEILTAEHWTRNLTSPVLFSQALERMCFAENGSAEVDMIVEIGAHSTLAGPIRQILKGREIFYASCLQTPVDAIEAMQNLACELVVRGYPVSLPSINSTAEESDIFLQGLPTYAWNHTSRYWTEPRISREIRHKKFEAHELLGSLLPGDNGLSPTWRNFLRLADMPWLIDHQVDSRVLLPTAAYIVMAIEAVRLVAGSGSKDTPHRFQLRDIEILNALALPDSSAGVEIQLNLHPSEDSWYEFTLSSLGPDDSGWLVCCKGFVSATEERARATENIEAAVLQKEFLDSETSTIDVDTLFSGLMDRGIYYGPAFRNITNITTSKNRSATDFEVSKSVSETHDYVIHPTTLDSVLQSTYIGIPSSVQNTFVVLPHFIKTISVRSSLSRYSGAKLQTRTETQSSDSQDFTSTVTVINQDGEKVLPAFHMDGFLARALLHRSDNTGKTPDQQPLTSKLEWELDAWNSIPPTLKDSMRITLGEQQEAFEKKIIRLSYYLIHDAVRELEPSSEKMQPHHKNLFSWMKEIVVLGSSGALAPRSKAWSRVGKAAKQLLVDEMNASENASARLTVRVGQNLARIVKGEISPLDLMMEGNLLNQYYMEYPKLKDRTYKHLFKVARLLSIARPGATVLEIGAGTGGATKVVLEAFSPDSARDSLVGHYTFTDVSSGFFSSARTKLLPWAKVIDFRPLNIEADLGDQEGSYDIIVASLVLHATKSLRKTMTNVRKLLKPGGKLLLIETTTDRLDLQLVFGTLPGWWLSEEPDRQKSPNVPLGTWDKVLRETGFTGIEFDIGDCEEREFQCTSLIVTSAAINASYPSSISLVQVGTPVPSALAWFQELGEAIRQRIGVTPKIGMTRSAYSQPKWTALSCMASLSPPLKSFEAYLWGVGVSCG
jgi:malonyl CoA-acyl carrier protein transacylase/ubiquinone/menaquinone biosynthesis C-methylase UbiE